MARSPERVLVAADGGPGIGLGHLTRGLAIATALESSGTWVGVVAPPGGAMRAAVAATGLSAVTVEDWPRWDSHGLRRLMELAASHRADAIVVDTYRLATAGIQRLRDCALFVLALDDLAAEPLPAHIVVNGGAAAPDLPYRSVHPSTRFFLGPRYVPLRAVFWKQLARDFRARATSVLVTTGGTDPDGLGARLAQALDALPFEFRLDVVVGPFGDRAALAAAARACRRDVRLHVEPSAAEMRDLALEADLAVSAGGGTLYELAWAGCPTVAFELAPNQAPNVRALGRAGVAVSAGAAGAADFLARVTEEVTGLLQSPSHRRALGDAGRALVDGRGAIRIAESLLGR